MTGFEGMDTDRARSTVRDLRTRAAANDDLAADVRAAIAVLPWDGPDAEAFRRDCEDLLAGPLTGCRDGLLRHADRLWSEARQQDLASAPGAPTVPGGPEPGRSGPPMAPATPGAPVDPTVPVGPGARCDPSTLPPVDTTGSRQGYLNEDNPLLPNLVEDPLEQFASQTTTGVGGLVDLGLQDGLDTVQRTMDGYGLRTDGIDQFQDDAATVTGILTDWASGQRVPTVAELGAAGLVAGGSGIAAGYELVLDEDTPLLDDRPGGLVTDVSSVHGQQAGPQDLHDLVLDNNALRLKGEDSEGRKLSIDDGQIGIQEVSSDAGGDPVYIVQVPPTEGEEITTFPGAWGEQGNSRDWGSNLREVAGQDPAAMDDVRAAMATPGADGRPLVPPGSRVMLVGHSQGGIIAAHLAADPSFNNGSGAAGSYDVTGTFSVGSPVQTVTPAQACTEVVNVTHGPVEVHADGTAEGDPVGHLDLQGAQLGGGSLAAPNVHEVVLDGGYEEPLLDGDEVPADEHESPGKRWLDSNHDSVGAEDGDPWGGYAGTVGRRTATDPTLAALQHDLEGTYLGPGTTVTASHVVTVGRGEP
jgi:hypothetical protein